MVWWRRVGLCALTSALLAVGTPPRQEPEPAAVSTKLAELRQAQRTYERVKDYDIVEVEQRFDAKRVLIQYAYEGTGREFDPFREHQEQIFSNVKEFYNRIGVQLIFLPKGEYFPPRFDFTHLLLHLVHEDDPKFSDIGLGGYAEPDEHYLVIKLGDEERTEERQDSRVYRIKQSDTLAHEIGHMFSLVHEYSFTWDNVHATVDGHTSNLMRMDSDVSVDCDTGICSQLIPEQVKQIHSFLGKGKVYQAYRRAGSWSKYVAQCNQAGLAKKQLDAILSTAKVR